MWPFNSKIAKKEVKILDEKNNEIPANMEYEDACDKADTDGTPLTLVFPNGAKLVREPKNHFENDRKRRLSKYVF